MEKFLLKDVMPTEAGYLIRPYLKLRGQKNGYKWKPNCNGHWGLFMENLIKDYTISITGM